MNRKKNSDANRVCLACGEIHKGKICPIIENKLNKYVNSKKRNYLMGNIFLKCIEKKVDFLQILLEIAELNEEAYDLSNFFETVLPIEQSIEYFATSLNCSSGDFFRGPEKTVEAYGNLIRKTDYEQMFLSRNEDSGEITAIELSLEIGEYSNVETISDYGPWTRDGYKFKLSKMRVGKDNWEYNLYLIIPIEINQTYSSGYQKEKHPSGRTYFFSSMNDTAATEFLLASDSNRIFEKIFERELDICWTDEELITDVTLDDSRYEIWINKLLLATKQKLLQWIKRDNDRFQNYHTFYEQTEVSLSIYKSLENAAIKPLEKNKNYINTELYIRNQEGGLGIRFRNLFRDKEAGMHDIRIMTLTKAIDLFLNNKENAEYLLGLKTKPIEYKDVVMATYSMICHDHFIKPLRGVVQLLTMDNEKIKYEIYVGYCSECNRYYCFKDDYIEMIKHGTPLCAIYEERRNEDGSKIHAFQYKSQSVLNAMGYTVGIEADLSANERQNILTTALHNKLFDVHDLISFLNWLIQTRKTQQKYNRAVKKWQEDLEFVKNYEIDSRQKVNIGGIVMK